MYMQGQLSTPEVNEAAKGIFPSHGAAGRGGVGSGGEAGVYSGAKSLATLDNTVVLVSREDRRRKNCEYILFSFIYFF